MAFYANKLRQLRKHRGLTQRELAEKLGLGKSAIGMYESGKRTPEFETLEAICDYFNVNMDVLSDTATPPKNDTVLSQHDLDLLAAYKAAPDNAKQVVDLTLEPYMPSSSENEDAYA